jgi:formiminoglutamase
MTEHAAVADEVTRVRGLHKHVVLYDCHSISPGELPVFNIGTNNGKACDVRLSDQIAAIAQRMWSMGDSPEVRSRAPTVDPAEGVHAVQMELAMRGHLRDESPPPPWDAEFAIPIQQDFARRPRSLPGLCSFLKRIIWLLASTMPG